MLSLILSFQRDFSIRVDNPLNIGAAPTILSSAKIQYCLLLKFNIGPQQYCLLRTSNKFLDKVVKLSDVIVFSSPKLHANSFEQNNNDSTALDFYISTILAKVKFICCDAFDESKSVLFYDNFQ